MEREELLRISNKNFKYVQDSNLKKYQYMDSWCFEYSKFLRNEVNNTKSGGRKKYKKYSKGTIVYAKLGINIGREFSGNHFCMVLNKTDSVNNPILTVIPLTSSSTRFNIKINEGLLQLATNILYNQAKTLAHKVLVTAENIIESGDPSLVETGKHLECETEKLMKVCERYERYRSTDTFANILNITSISKERITKINDYDPSGEMTYSEETIKRIDESIKNRFLN
ncbi:type II toxin-antitoxin system PemK/MazF family toxin [Staphylococcus chromogenes]|uniref:type II toxin-antitoxin system PemK/MazF family toxin n=1 Tax=Staphylococcus chromogenes TaxID=46126 RepID=UPI0021CEAA5F|nr:type II toxin-antitoxin system PemK/MazF family toxin [Staphylococcus chromogenes]UXS75028.1 type II toxin-antitoxin system PemK/MazF family toxin [Staphylococcus chromogenes]